VPVASRPRGGKRASASAVRCSAAGAGGSESGAEKKKKCPLGFESSAEKPSSPWLKLAAALGKALAFPIAIALPAAACARTALEAGWAAPFAAALAAAVALATAVLVSARLQAGKVPPADLPGPKGIPFLGNTLQIVSDMPAFTSKMDEWAFEHGQAGIYQFTMFGRTYACLCSEETIGEVLRARPFGFTRRQTFAERFPGFGIHGLFSAEGTYWGRLRRLSTAAFAPEAVPAMAPAVASTAGALAASWKGSSRVHDVGAATRLYALDVLCRAGLGWDLRALSTREGQALSDVIFGLFQKLGELVAMPFPYWKWGVELPGDREFKRLSAQVDAALGPHVDEAASRGGEGGDLLAAMLRAEDPESTPEGRRLTREEAMWNAKTFLLAGSDTTAHTLTWCLYYLARDPALQAAVREEAAGGADGPRPLAEAVVKEALRLHSPTAFLLFEAVEGEGPVRVGGIDFPRDTIFTTLLRIPGQDPRNVPRAAEFDPSRWAAGAEGAAGLEAYAALNFGGGPRQCPARALAMHEACTAIAAVLSELKISLPEGCPAPKEVYQFTSVPDRVSIDLQPV